jgi:hypothetical protein
VSLVALRKNNKFCVESILTMYHYERELIITLVGILIEKYNMKQNKN